MYDFEKIAKLAAEAGWDQLTLSPCGDKAWLECVCRKPGRRVDSACVELDAPFNAVEFKALKGFEAAGWDARFSTSGVRAYKTKVSCGERMFQNLPPVPPPPDPSRELRRVA